MKKFLSISLILCVLCSCLVVTSHASNGEEKKTMFSAEEKYISVLSAEPNKVYPSSADNIFAFTVSPESEHQYVEASYSSTESLSLDKYSSDMIQYSTEDYSLEIEFDLSEYNSQKTFYWCIATKQSDAPSTGYYFSRLLPINLE